MSLYHLQKNLTNLFSETTISKTLILLIIIINYICSIYKIYTILLVFLKKKKTILLVLGKIKS